MTNTTRYDATDPVCKPQAGSTKQKRQPRLPTSNSREIDTARKPSKAERLAEHAAKMRKRPYRENGIKRRNAILLGWGKAGA